MYIEYVSTWILKERKFYKNKTKESSSSTINDFNSDSKNTLREKLKILNINNSNKYYEKIPITMIVLDDYIIEKNFNILIY